MLGEQKDAKFSRWNHLHCTHNSTGVPWHSSLIGSGTHGRVLNKRRGQGQNFPIKCVPCQIQRGSMPSSTEVWLYITCIKDLKEIHLKCTRDYLSAGLCQRGDGYAVLRCWGSPQPVTGPPGLCWASYRYKHGADSIKNLKLWWPLTKDKNFSGHSSELGIRVTKSICMTLQNQRVQRLRRVNGQYFYWQKEASERQENSKTAPFKDSIAKANKGCLWNIYSGTP